MAKRDEPVNPFYVILVIVGTAFTITACAYGLMSLRAVRARPVPNESEHALMTLLDRHGREIMAAEVALLALCAFAAMGLDRVRQKRLETLETKRRVPESRTPDNHGRSQDSPASGP